MSTVPAQPICTTHAAHGSTGPARACAARDCAATTSPAHGRRCRERHGGVPSTGGIDGGVMKATTPRLTDGVGDDSIRTARRSAARHELLGGDRCGRSASVAWHVGHAWSEADSGGQRRVVGTRHGDGAIGRRLSGRRRAVPTAPLRRGVWHGSVAATRRRRVDRWARRRKQRLTGGPLMLVISELKFTPERKLIKINC
jgi:hypothetical protein